MEFFSFYTGAFSGYSIRFTIEKERNLVTDRLTYPQAGVLRKVPHGVKLFQNHGDLQSLSKFYFPFLKTQITRTSEIVAANNALRLKPYHSYTNTFTMHALFLVLIIWFPVDYKTTTIHLITPPPLLNLSLQFATVWGIVINMYKYLHKDGLIKIS